MHRHICGVRALFPREEPPRQVSGCGFMWEHGRVGKDSDRVYRDKHMCPNCGVGPWYGVADTEAVWKTAYPMPPRVAFGRVVRPADDNLAYVKPEEMEEFLAYARSGDNQEERQLKAFLNSLITDGMLPSDGMQVIVFDEENKTISGFELEPRRRRR